MESADEILARLQIDAHFSTDRTVHLSQQSRGRLHKRNSAQISCGNETREIAHDTSAQGDDKTLSLEPMLREAVIAELHALHTLGPFTRGNRHQDRSKAGLP